MATALQNARGRVARRAAETRIGMTPVAMARAACHASSSESTASSSDTIVNVPA